MIRFIVASLALTLAAGCASATLTEQGKKVRLVSSTPQGCKYLGEVAGSYRGDSVSGGIVGDTTEAARVDIKNQAAKMGADTIELDNSNVGGESGHSHGEAYRCEK